MTVLVTGASGGIGYAVTEYLASKGIGVYACDLREREFSSPTINFFKLDISNPDEVKAVAEERWQARLDKNWAKSDELRAKLNELGYAVKDSKTGYELTKL